MPAAAENRKGKKGTAKAGVSDEQPAGAHGTRFSRIVTDKRNSDYDLLGTADETE